MPESLPKPLLKDIVSIDSTLASKVGMSSTAEDYWDSSTFLATTGINTISDSQDLTIVRAMTMASTMEDLGATGSLTLVSDGEEVSITVNNEMTVNDLLTMLAGYGVSGRIDNGFLTFLGGVVPSTMFLTIF